MASDAADPMTSVEEREEEPLPAASEGPAIIPGDSAEAVQQESSSRQEHATAAKPARTGKPHARPAHCHCTLARRTPGPRMTLQPQSALPSVHWRHGVLPQKAGGWCIISAHTHTCTCAWHRCSLCRTHGAPALHWWCEEPGLLACQSYTCACHGGCRPPTCCLSTPKGFQELCKLTRPAAKLGDAAGGIGGGSSSSRCPAR